MSLQTQQWIIERCRAITEKNWVSKDSIIQEIAEDHLWFNKFAPKGESIHAHGAF